MLYVQVIMKDENDFFFFIRLQFNDYGLFELTAPESRDCLVFFYLS